MLLFKPMVLNLRLGVYLGVKTHEVFLCFVAFARVWIYCVDFLVFFDFKSLGSVTGSYSEDESRLVANLWLYNLLAVEVVAQPELIGSIYFCFVLVLV